MDSGQYKGDTGGRPHVGALAVVSELARRVAAEPGSLEEGLRETARGLTEELGLGALVLEVSVGGDEIRVSAGEAEDGPEPLEVPILRDRLEVGRILAFAGSGEASEDIGDVLVPVADVLSLAVSTAEADTIAARRAAQGSIVQLASEALSRTLEEGEIHRTVLALAIELLDSRAGAVFTGGGDPAVAAGFAAFPQALEALGSLGRPNRGGWRGQIEGGYAVGVSFGKQEGSIFLFRGERAYTEAEVVSLRLVARQLSYARERSRLYAALEQRDLEAILALSAALESRDGTTGEHIDRTQHLAEHVALDLGLEPAQARVARYAAILHDIGKIGIPDAILGKPTALSEEEWEIMRRHPAMGANILASIAGFERISEAVLAHHERFDGGGYPQGLSGERIPVEARIISVVDAYDAMTNERPYRKAMSHEEALRELQRGTGTQFDPRVVESMQRVVGRKLAGAYQPTPYREEATQ